MRHTVIFFKFMFNGIEIVSVWEDVDLIEINIQASNGLFAGATNCYSQRREIEEFANILLNFEINPNNTKTLSNYINDNLSYFSITIKCLDKTGLINVRVKIEEIITLSNNSQKENNIAEFDFNVDPISIEDFGKSLKHLSKSEIKKVTAKLMAKI